MNLNETAEKSGTILAPAHSSGGRDLGLEVRLENAAEKQAFARLFHDWVQQVLCKSVNQNGWAPGLQNAGVPLPLAENPLGVLTQKWGVMLVDGVDPNLIFSTQVQPHHRLFGCNTLYGSESRRATPQFAHVDGLATRYDGVYQELTGLIAMFSRSGSANGTFVGWQDDLIPVTADTVERHRDALERIFPPAKADESTTLEQIISDLRRGVDPRKASYELLRRLRMVNDQTPVPEGLDLLNDVVGESIRNLAQLVHLQLSPTRWAFLHEEDIGAPKGTAHGRLNGSGGHTTLDL